MARSKMTPKDEYLRGYMDVAALAILSTLDILLFITAWTKVIYSTFPLSSSTRYTIDIIIAQNVPILNWIWLYLPDFYYDPKVVFPVAIITSRLGIFAIITLVSAVWLRYQVTNLWAAMRDAKAQDRVARFSRKSNSQSIGFGSIQAGGNVSLAQTISSNPNSKRAESAIGKIFIVVGGQVLLLLIAKLIG